jgi:N-acetylglucosaminyldiphosphoundecaprenol N-acetyl-beta-D-mannosaminyltransferase
MHGERLAANLNGTDLVPELCGRLAAMGCSVYLLGGQPGVAEAAAKALIERHPGLRIAGIRHGLFTDAEETEVVATVNRSGADVLIAGLGVPKQDVFLARQAERLDASLTIGVGALFDFLAGRVSRAPEALRRAGPGWNGPGAWRRSRAAWPAAISWAIPLSWPAPRSRPPHRPALGWTLPPSAPLMSPLQRRG